MPDFRPFKDSHEKWPREIDGLPIKDGDFPLAILNYQRVPILFGLIIRSR